MSRCTRNILLLLLAGLFAAGCSRSESSSKPENKNGLDQNRTVSVSVEKVEQTREAALNGSARKRGTGQKKGIS
jgi:uncharacterized lipoprotein YajG